MRVVSEGGEGGGPGLGLPGTYLLKNLLLKQELDILYTTPNSRMLL